MGGPRSSRTSSRTRCGARPSKPPRWSSTSSPPCKCTQISSLHLASFGCFPCCSRKKVTSGRCLGAKGVFEMRDAREVQTGRDSLTTSSNVVSHRERRYPFCICRFGGVASRAIRDSARVVEPLAVDKKGKVPKKYPNVEFYLEGSNFVTSLPPPRLHPNNHSGRTRSSWARRARGR
jgi:hypothetical protein